MKKVLLGIAAIGVFALTAGDASAAGTLYTPSWYLQGNNVNVNIAGTGHTFATGSFNSFYDPDGAGPLGSNPVSPVFCIDINHTFGFGNTWGVNTYYVPPDPSPGSLPFNTIAAAYLYQTFGKYLNPGVGDAANRMTALQIALWEVTHQADAVSGFGTTYNAGNWYSTGDFQWNSGAGFNETSLNYATTYMVDLVNNVGTSTHRAIYYEPTGSPGQGFVGDVPEPGTILMIGLGLLGMAGVTARRRRKIG